MVTYEERLNGNLDWALREGSMHFAKASAVHQTLRRIVQRLDGLGIPYALVGGMAMFFHGYRHFTEAVDILVSRDGLEEIHCRLEGSGYVPPFAGSKQLRDTEYGVKVEFLVAGDFPGDGKPKPIAFLRPEEVRVEIDGVHCVQLPRLIDLKLASGMTNPGRINDLGDVQKLIQTLDLAEGLADDLHPFVRAKYRELWTAVRHNPADA